MSARLSPRVMQAIVRVLIVPSLQENYSGESGKVHIGTSLHFSDTRVPMCRRHRRASVSYLRRPGFGKTESQDPATIFSIFPQWSSTRLTSGPCLGELARLALIIRSAPLGTDSPAQSSQLCSGLFMFQHFQEVITRKKSGHLWVPPPPLSPCSTSPARCCRHTLLQQTCSVLCLLMLSAHNSPRGSWSRISLILQWSLQLLIFRMTHLWRR